MTSTVAETGATNAPSAPCGSGAGSDKKPQHSSGGGAKAEEAQEAQLALPPKATEDPLAMSWLMKCPCVGSRESKGVLDANPLVANDCGPPITVRTSTPGGLQEVNDFNRDASVKDLRRSFRTLNGKPYKLLSRDGRELSNEDYIAAFIDSEESTELQLTKVNILHPVDMDTLNSLDPKKDAFHCDVFPLGILKVSMGLGKYGNATYSTIIIDDPQSAFHTAGKLEPYRAGYDYFDTLERYEIGEGRFRFRILPERKAELEAEFKKRLPEFRLLSPQIFENPNRIYKLRSFMDKEDFLCTRENLYRFLQIFFDILTDKSAMLL